MINNEKIEEFVRKFPTLTSAVKVLNDASIDWLIGGSSCLFLLGNKRIPDDVDIFIPNDQHDKVDALFGMKSYTHNSPAGPVRNSNPNGDHSIQFTSHVEFNYDKHYEFRIIDTVLRKKVDFKIASQNLYLLPPEDVLLIKALLQRGPAEGKKDIEDINNFVAIYKIDQKYLSERISELGAEDRVKNIFNI